jgi:hypothetical protein
VTAAPQAGAGVVVDAARADATRTDAGRVHAGTPPFHRVRRRFAACWAPSALAGEDGAPSLERLQALPTDPPRLRGCRAIEGHAVRAVRVADAPGTAADDAQGFAAFLDGTQQTRPLGYPEGLPVVFGTVAAVIRARRNRRMSTWGPGPRIERRVYAPLAPLSERARDAVVAAVADLPGVALVDTSLPDRHGEPPSAHPAALTERALAMVKEDRERVEKHVAELWCGRDEGALFVDGGIQESEIVARATCVVGVVKSHRTLYAEGDALRAVLGLRAGERTSAFVVGSGARRTPVASWYLRLRDPGGHDPMWGLVRLEAAMPDAGEAPGALTERADRLSRWVLGEVSPVALPDGRWDRLAYGIYDCEQFLRAVC